MEVNKENEKENVDSGEEDQNDEARMQSISETSLNVITDKDTGQPPSLGGAADSPGASLLTHPSAAQHQQQQQQPVAPVNVVITSSDTLPTSAPPVQPTLSVTIPPQHLLGTPLISQPPAALHSTTSSAFTSGTASCSSVAKSKRKMEDDELQINDSDCEAEAVSDVSCEEASGSSSPPSPRKIKKKEEEDKGVWKWWQEEEEGDDDEEEDEVDDDGEENFKWTFLEHSGPLFPPPYQRLPHNVMFLYNGEEMQLSEKSEEVASFYAQLLSRDCVNDDTFNKQFFSDWQSLMTQSEKNKITDFSKCDFTQIHTYLLKKSKECKAMSNDEKKKIKNENVNKYGFCTMDGHREPIANYTIEPPGLFHGRGDHPKRGCIKSRIFPEDITINCSTDAVVPNPPQGNWKEIVHNPKVSWLASWTDNIQGKRKYMSLNPASKLKSEQDWKKFECARKLSNSIGNIRREYQQDMTSESMETRQRAVALYLIDKLAIRAGNVKKDDQADTVGCCTLRVEHLKLYDQKDGKEFVVEFNFPGKDSIDYHNEVEVDKSVYDSLKLCMTNKNAKDELLDLITPVMLNEYLSDRMNGLTVKVFRTYNACITFQEELKKTDPDSSTEQKILTYNRANRTVAVLCNHQKTTSKSFSQTIETLKGKINSKKDKIQEKKQSYDNLVQDYSITSSSKTKTDIENTKKALDKLNIQLEKLELQATEKEENREIALSTSKLNYIDPRISVAWCKKYNVPVERIFTTVQRRKFLWAIEKTDQDFVF